MRVRAVPAEATYELRRQVLRQGAPDAEVALVGDVDPGAFHLALADDEGRLVAVASAHPAPTEHRPGRRWWRVRGMAVEPGHQGRGLGAVLLEAVVTRARDLGAEGVWAAGRDPALGFYRRQGWTVEGEGYLAAGGLPHHTVLLDLVATGPGAAPVSMSGDRPGGEAGAPSGRSDPAGDEES